MGTAAAVGVANEGYAAFIERAVFERNASSLVALIFVLCEFFANLEDELRYIWRWPLNQVKAIYLFTRYTALLGLTANAIVLLFGPLSTNATPIEHCRAWFTALTVVSCSVLFSIDAIAMLRVYALYNRNVKIGAFFTSVLLTEATLVTTCSTRTVGKVPFSPICDVEKTPWHVIYFTCGVIFAQCSLLFFTLLKRQELAGQRPIPMLSLVFRDGTWICTLVCCEFLFMVPYSLITGTSKPHLVLVWPIALFSTASCRAVLNMHRLRDPNESQRNNPSDITTNTDIQFTSYLDLSDSNSRYSRQTRLSTIPGNSVHSFDLRHSSEKSSDTVCTFPPEDEDKLSSLSLTLSTPSMISRQRRPPSPGILLRPERPVSPISISAPPRDPHLVDPVP